MRLLHSEVIREAAWRPEVAVAADRRHWVNMVELIVADDEEEVFCAVGVVAESVAAIT